MKIVTEQPKVSCPTCGGPEGFAPRRRHKHQDGSSTFGWAVDDAGRPPVVGPCQACFAVEKSLTALVSMPFGVIAVQLAGAASVAGDGGRVALAALLNAAASAAQSMEG
jgi:hypothetical protein